MASDGETGGTDRTRSLSLTEEEAEYLWEMMKREIGKEEVLVGDHRDIVESLHTKVWRTRPQQHTETTNGEIND